jgi:hypothetical protein
MEKAAELGGRGEEDGGGGVKPDERGDLALANSMVARLSVFGRGEEARGAGSFTVATVSSVPGGEVRMSSSDLTGAPQAEQKRLGMGTSALQVRQRAMNFSGDSVTEGAVAGSSGVTRGLMFVLLRPARELLVEWPSGQRSG